MSEDDQATTRTQVIEAIIRRIRRQCDDPDRSHDGYQRRLIIVQGTDAGDAVAACRGIAERLQPSFGTELRMVRLAAPPGRQRYRFDAAHARTILQACGTAPHRLGARYTFAAHEAWPRPVLLLIENADVMAQASRNIDAHLYRAGDHIRGLSDATRVRQVLFGSAGLRRIYDTNDHLMLRTDAFHLDPDENRRLLRKPGNPSTSELVGRITRNETLH